MRSHRLCVVTLSLFSLFSLLVSTLLALTGLYHSIPRKTLTQRRIDRCFVRCSSLPCPAHSLAYRR